MIKLQKILEKLILIVKANSEEEVEITAETKFFQDLGLDSLDLILIMLSVEEEFSIIISNPDEILREIKTVGELAEVVILAIDPEKDIIAAIANYVSQINNFSVQENIKLLADKPAKLLPQLKITWEEATKLIFWLEKCLEFKISNQTYWDIETVGNLLDAFSPVVKKSSSPKSPYQGKNIGEATLKATLVLHQGSPDGRPKTSKCEGPHAIGNDL